MTLLTTTSDIQYAGIIGQTTFVYNFRVDLKTDMNVTLDNVPVAQGDFTMTGLGTPSGGNVVLNTGLVAAATVILFRIVPQTQEVDYQPFDAFPAETHESALDKLTMLVQQNSSTATRSLQFPVGDASSGTLPDSAARNNKIFGFDVNGDIDLNVTQLYTQPEKDKLAGIEALADVTDAINVNAAGAVMHTDITATEGMLRKTGSESYTAIKSNLTATINPAASDNFAAGYAVSSTWINTTLASEKAFTCVGDGVWVEGGSAGGAITSLTGALPIVIGGTSAIPDIQLDGQNMPRILINKNIVKIALNKANAPTDEGLFEIEVLDARFQITKKLDNGGAAQNILSCDVVANTLVNVTLGGPLVILTGGNLQLGATLITATGAMINDIDRVNNQKTSFQLTLSGRTTPGTPTYSGRTGYYYRIGNLVHVEVAVTITNKGGMVGLIDLGGFPFNFDGTIPTRAGLGGSTGFTGVPSTNIPMLSGLVGSQSMGLNHSNPYAAGPLIAIDGTDLADSTTLISSFSYITEDA